MFIVKNKKLGFSLLELVLAIAVFSLGSFAVATMLIDSNISTKLSSERIEALFYAKEGIDAVRSIKENTAWAEFSDGEYGLDNSGGNWVLSVSPDLINDKYTRTVTVEAVEGFTTVKNVSVEIAWDLTPARRVSTVLSTVLTNWENN